MSTRESGSDTWPRFAAFPGDNLDLGNVPEEDDVDHGAEPPSWRAGAAAVGTGAGPPDTDTEPDEDHDGQAYAADTGAAGDNGAVGDVTENGAAGEHGETGTVGGLGENGAAPGFGNEYAAGGPLVRRRPGRIPGLRGRTCRGRSIRRRCAPRLLRRFAVPRVRRSGVNRVRRPAGGRPGLRERAAGQLRRRLLR